MNLLFFSPKVKESRFIAFGEVEKSIVGPWRKQEIRFSSSHLKTKYLAINNPSFFYSEHTQLVQSESYFLALISFFVIS